MSQPATFLCIAFYFKGLDFLRACKSEGNKVFLLTKQSLADKDWPRESIDEFFFMEKDDNSLPNFEQMGQGMAYLFRNHRIDRVVALDDFDVEKAAFLREQFRIPGMGQTTARYFRDKLAMRMKAQEQGVNVPPFCALFNDEQISHFAATVNPPWIVKPRSEASAVGMQKVYHRDQLMEVVTSLGDHRHEYLVEQFKPGDVYHADSLSVDGKVIFCRVSKYLDTPFEVAHGGGVFRSHTLEFGDEEELVLQKMTAEVMTAFGMNYSASHTEFIKAREDSRFYFLETASRVGGAHIAEMVEASSGINLWKEWAKIESAELLGRPYELPEVKYDHAGIIVSLSRFEYPDTSSFDDPEVVWRIKKPHHIGMIVRTTLRQKVLDLLDDYLQRIVHNFHASLPPQDKPTD